MSGGGLDYGLFISPMRLPSGSANIAIDGPPGTSIGGMTVVAPRGLRRVHLGLQVLHADEVLG